MKEAENSAGGRGNIRKDGGFFRGYVCSTRACRDIATVSYEIHTVKVTD
jgi:hypothetical protein